MKSWSISKQLYIIAGLPALLALLAFAVFNYQEVTRVYTINMNQNVGILKKLTPSFMQISNKPFDYLEEKYTSRLAGLGVLWKGYLDTCRVEPAEIDLERVAAILGQSSDLESVYLVDTAGVVFNTTFAPDSGLRLFDYGDIHRRLYEDVMKADAFKAFEPVREQKTGRFRKFAYLPDSRKRFMIEVGTYVQGLDSIVDFVRENMNHVIENYPEVLQVDVLYGFEDVIVLNGSKDDLDEVKRLNFFQVINQRKNLKVDVSVDIEHHYMYLPKARNTQLKETVVLLVIDKRVREAELSKLLSKMLITLLILILLAVALITLNARWIVRPLRSLVDTVRLIESGHLNARAKMVGSSEIKYLATTVNSMADQIQDSYVRLEQKVARRTETINLKNVELLEQKAKLEEQNMILNEAKQHIERQQQDILAGIRAAERLQRMILPKEKDLISLTRSAFIINIPKDYVSGDFYWAAQMNDKVIIALGDCTGHGISGAILSILGNEIFNTVIRVKEFTAPNEILKAVDSGLRKILHDESSLHYKDGMDLAVCAIDMNTMRMEYAAANTRLYLCRKKVVTELKGDKSSIGDVIQRSEQKFTNFEADLEKGDMVYLTSDGFADQFGGESNKKFTRKKLRDLLSASSRMPITLQKLHIVNEFINWKADNFQVDDVLMIGVRV